MFPNVVVLCNLKIRLAKLGLHHTLLLPMRECGTPSSVRHTHTHKAGYGVA